MGQAYFVLDKAECLSTIKQEFSRYHKNRGLVVLIFCPPNSEHYFQIARSANFWNRYSGRDVTILFPGYVGYLNCPDEPFADQVEMLFDYNSFKEVVDYFEDETIWKYNGGTELIMVMAGIMANELCFGYDRAAVVDVDEKGDKKDFNFGKYIKNIINAAKNSPEDPFLELGRRQSVGIIGELVTAALPQQLRDILAVVQKYGIKRNISRPNTAASG